MNKLFKSALGALCAAIAICPMTAVQANPITFEVTFTNNSLAIGDSLYGRYDELVAPPTIGSQYKARIMIDDAVLQGDGLDKPVQVLGFTAQIGDSIWDPSVPSAFAGFRGPCFSYLPWECTTTEQFNAWAYTSDLLGLDVQNGIITGLRGGVYGSGDEPYIDFMGNTFRSIARFQTILPPLDDRYVYDDVWTAGTMSIAVIPEPATLMLLTLGLAGIVGSRRTKR